MGDDPQAYKFTIPGPLLTRPLSGHNLKTQLYSFGGRPKTSLLLLHIMAIIAKPFMLLLTLLAVAATAARAPMARNGEPMPPQTTEDDEQGLLPSIDHEHLEPMSLLSEDPVECSENDKKGHHCGQLHHHKGPQIHHARPIADQTSQLAQHENTVLLLEKTSVLLLHIMAAVAESFIADQTTQLAQHENTVLLLEKTSVLLLHIMAAVAESFMPLALFAVIATTARVPMVRNNEPMLPRTAEDEEPMLLPSIIHENPELMPSLLDDPAECSKDYKKGHYCGHHHHHKSCHHGSHPPPLPQSPPWPTLSLGPPGPMPPPRELGPQKSPGEPGPPPPPSQ
ncbi:hypothetical protein Ancab_032964 [Ancistrocladus abbreviatus]